MARPRRSLKRQYLDWVEERIEDHKAELTREELLSLADEAVQDLFHADDGQYPLTEILLKDAVDALIVRRLGLPSFRVWRKTCQNDTDDRPPEATGGGGDGELMVS
jgi:hypothetical protein